MGSITVYYKNIFIAGNPTPYYHEYLVYTTDSGVQYYTRGGPSAAIDGVSDGGGGSGSSGSDSGSGSSPTMSGNFPFGKLVTQTGNYDKSSPDYAPPGTDPSETLVTGPDSQLGTV